MGAAQVCTGPPLDAPGGQLLPLALGLPFGSGAGFGVGLAFGSGVAIFAFFAMGSVLAGCLRQGEIRATRPGESRQEVCWIAYVGKMTMRLSITSLTV